MALDKQTGFGLTVDGIVDEPTFDLLCTSAPGDLCTG